MSLICCGTTHRWILRPKSEKRSVFQNRRRVVVCSTSLCSASSSPLRSSKAQSSSTRGGNASCVRFSLYLPLPIGSNDMHFRSLCSLASRSLPPRCQPWQHDAVPERNHLDGRLKRLRSILVDDCAGSSWKRAHEDNTVHGN